MWLDQAHRHRTRSSGAVACNARGSKSSCNAIGHRRLRFQACAPALNVAYVGGTMHASGAAGAIACRCTYYASMLNPHPICISMRGGRQVGPRQRTLIEARSQVHAQRAYRSAQPHRESYLSGDWQCRRVGVCEAAMLSGEGDPLAPIRSGRLRSLDRGHARAPMTACRGAWAGAEEPQLTSFSSSLLSGCSFAVQALLAIDVLGSAQRRRAE